MKTRVHLLLAFVVLAAGAGYTQAQGTPQWKFTEGVHYERLIPAQGTSSPADKIEVAEFFWYGCVFCYRMDAYVEEWKKKQPDEVNFIHIPAIWNEYMLAHARLFLTLAALSKLEAAHREVFRAYHTEQRPLLTLSDQEGFAKRYGIAADDYRSAFRSFGVQSDLTRIQDLTLRYRVLAVPSFVVNGKYVVRGGQTSDMPELLEIVDELVQRELTER